MKIISQEHDFDDTKIAIECDPSLSSIPDTTGLVLGAWLIALQYTVEQIKDLYNINHLIVFNQEQYRKSYTRIWNERYYTFLSSADEVWDYDEYNITMLYNELGIQSKLYLLKYTKKFDIVPFFKHPIDVFFYGRMDKRRELIINSLKHKGYCVFTIDKQHPLWGDELIPLLASSKVLLNIHSYDDIALQEQARMIRWLSLKPHILSETSLHNYLSIHEVPYEKLVSETIEMIKSTTT